MTRRVRKQRGDKKLPVVPRQPPVASVTKDSTPKKVYLIRHGQSLGQKTPRNLRKRDPSLIDCGLTDRGRFEATFIPNLLGSKRYDEVDYVVSSPLTRAVHTSLLGFATKQIVIHYDLFEVGGGDPIPENQPRSLKDVLFDVGGKDRVDGLTFAAPRVSFPASHATMATNERKWKMKQAFSDLWNFCQERGCKSIAIVCHFNVIRTVLPDGHLIHPENAIPMECLLCRNGELRVVEILDQPHAETI